MPGAMQEREPEGAGPVCEQFLSSQDQRAELAGCQEENVRAEGMLEQLMHMQAGQMGTCTCCT